MPSLPVCPILSIRNSEINELCVGEQCALFLPSAQKCSLVYIGLRSLMEVQRLQQGAQQGNQPPQNR